MEAEKKKYYLFEMNLKWLNIFSIILLLTFFIITIVLGKKIDFNGNAWIVTLLLFIPYLILHEILHGVSYVLHGVSFKNITFGAHLEKGILCCLCKQNVSRKNILISLLYPFFWIGIVTYMIGIIMNNSVLILLSILNISGCSGDIMMFLAFLKLKEFEYSEYDNPTSFGLYSNKDLSHTKLLGLKYIDVKEELEKENFKKVTISKESIIYFLLFLLIIFLYLL